MQTYNYYHDEPFDKEADRLLSRIARDDYPHFTIPTLARRMYRDRHREERYQTSPAPADEAVTFLQRRTLASVIAAARLTRRQAAVIDARVEGASWAEIGKRFGHSKQGARRVFLHAVDKIRCAWRLCSMVGIDEVYRSEVHRRGPNRR